MADYESRQKDIERRRKLAEALLAQSRQPMQGQMAGRFYVPASPLQGVANLVNQYAGQRMSRDVDKQETDLQAQRRQALIDTLTKANEMETGTPDTVAQSDPTNVYTTRTTPGRKPDARGAINLLLQNPDTQQYGITRMQDSAKRQEAADAKRQEMLLSSQYRREEREESDRRNAELRRELQERDAQLRRELTDKNNQARVDAKNTLSPDKLQKVKSKQQSINALKMQLQKVRDSFSKIKGSASAGMLQGYLPTEGGQEFDRSVAMLAPLARQITRTPGEGSMSDYESRLVQLGLPSRTNYENVTENQIRDWEDLINVLEQGYAGFTPDQQVETPALVPSQPQQPTSGALTPEEQAELEQLRARFKK